MTAVESDVVVGMDDIREAKRRHGGFCTRGVSAWLDRHDMSLRELSRSGYPVEMIEAIGDGFGSVVAAIARERANKGS